MRNLSLWLHCTRYSFETKKFCSFWQVVSLVFQDSLAIICTLHLRATSASSRKRSFTTSKFPHLAAK